jgi:hypothetical protein
LPLPDQPSTVAGSTVIHHGGLRREPLEHEARRDFLAFAAQHLVDQQQALARRRRIDVAAKRDLRDFTLEGVRQLLQGAQLVVADWLLGHGGRRCCRLALLR